MTLRWIKIIDENHQVVFVKSINYQKEVTHDINVRPEGSTSNVEERIHTVCEKISNMQEKSMLTL